MKKMCIVMLTLMAATAVSLADSGVDAGPDQGVWLESGTAQVVLDGAAWGVDSIEWWQYISMPTYHDGPTIFDPGHTVLNPTVTFTEPGFYAFILEGYVDGEKIPWAGNYWVAVTVYAEGTAKLVGHWPLDGNANDISGYGHHGIVHGNPQYVEGRMGQQAMQFDGRVDGVEIPNEPFFDGLHAEKTVSFWVKVPNGARPFGNIVGKLNIMHAPTTDPLFRSKAAGYGWSIANVPHFSEDIVYYTWGHQNRVLWPNWYNTQNDGKWHHITVVKRSNNTASYYVDGVLIRTKAGLFRESVTEGNEYLYEVPLTFGYLYSTPGVWNWEGTLSDVRLFDYPMLDAEVQALFLETGGRRCTEPLDGDLNGDCQVDMADLEIFLGDWLECTNFYPEDCF